MRHLPGTVRCGNFWMNSRTETRMYLPPSWQVWGSCGIGDITASRFPKRSMRGLFELRHVGKLNTRVLWLFTKGRRIIVVHGIRSKGQAIAARDLRTARERMADWKKRAK